MAQQMFKFEDIGIGKPFLSICTLHVKTSKTKGMPVIVGRGGDGSKATTFKDDAPVEKIIKMSYRGSAGSSLNLR